MWGLILTVVSILIINSVESASVPNNSKLKIINGDEVAPHSAPYMAYIRIRKTGDRIRECGGTLLNEFFVLTAAECLTQAQQVNVSLGVHKLNEHDPNIRQDITSPIWKTVFPQDDKRHNIGIIRLEYPATLSDYVKSVPNSFEEKPLEYKPATVYGWGEIQYPYPFNRSDVLRKGTQTVVPRQLCMDYGVSVTEESICTVPDTNTSTCINDIGGPLMVDGRQIGVLTSTVERCAVDKFNVYTSMYYYEKWMVKTMRKLM